MPPVPKTAGIIAWGGGDADKVCGAGDKAEKRAEPTQSTGVPAPVRRGEPIVPETVPVPGISVIPLPRLVLPRHIDHLTRPPDGGGELVEQRNRALYIEVAHTFIDFQPDDIGLDAQRVAVQQGR